MQDRFNFRCYHKIYKKIYDVYSITPFGVVIGSLAVSNKKTNFEDCILMQCTGLKDKNGKLIYEGDIVNLKNTRSNFEQTHVVMFKNCAFQFSLPNSMQIDRPLYCWAINYLNHYKHIDLEVLGNIYENPELLTEEVQA